MAGSWARFAVLIALAWPGLACHSILGPSSVDENWRVVDMPHFSFHVRPGSFAEQHTARLGEVLEDQYAYTLRALEIQYAGRISMFLFESGADAGLESERSGTAYPDTEAVRAVVNAPLETTYHLLSHESNHVILDNAMGRGGTYFMVEGLPSAVISERFHVQGTTFLYTWTGRNDARIPRLSDLVDDDAWEGYDQQVSYNASASFLAYLLQQAGAQRLRQLQPVNSADFQRRFQELYGRSLDDAESEWRTFCAAFRP